MSGQLTNRAWFRNVGGRRRTQRKPKQARGEVYAGMAWPRIETPVPCTLKVWLYLWDGQIISSRYCPILSYSALMEAADTRHRYFRQEELNTKIEYVLLGS